MRLATAACHSRTCTRTSRAPRRSTATTPPHSTGKPRCSISSARWRRLSSLLSGGGVPIDTDAARDILAQSAEKLELLPGQLIELAGQPFLLNSARQIQEALNARGLDLSRASRTPTGLLATSADALKLVGDELTDRLLEHRLERVFYGLLENLLERTHDDRLYGSFRQVGAETGRMSSGNPNLQNIPATDFRARYEIRAPEGRILVGAELSNVELRVPASYAPGGRLERALAVVGE